MSYKERVVFLFTTFPVRTETFLQRELIALDDSGFVWKAISMFRGGHFHQLKNTQLERFRLFELLILLFWIPFWLIRKPKVVFQMLKWVFRKPVNTINYLENLLGMGFALSNAWSLEKARVHHIHAAWASAPAMGAMGIHLLTNIPYSFGGHAYDLFESGGDGWLGEKIRHASFVRTSTLAGVQRFLEKGSHEEDTLLVRRGLLKIPPFVEEKSNSDPIRIVSVGRLVPKMGYEYQLKLYRALLEKQLSFSARIIGGGPLKDSLEQLRDQLELKDRVKFLGQQDYSEVEELLRDADLFLFTGCVDPKGDRAGFPNAIGEAMAFGVPVAAVSVGGVSEGISDGLTGISIGSFNDSEKIISALKDRPLINKIRRNAHSWVQDNFQVHVNVRKLADKIQNDLEGIH